MTTRFFLIASFLFAFCLIANTETALGATQDDVQAEQAHIERDKYGQYWHSQTMLNSLETQTVAYQRPATDDEIKSSQLQETPTLRTNDVKLQGPEKESPTSSMIVAPTAKQLAPTPLPRLPRKFSASQMRTINRAVRKAVAPHIKRITALEASLIGKNAEIDAKNDEIAAMKADKQVILDSSKAQIDTADRINAAVDRLIIEQRDNNFYISLYVLATAFIVLMAILYFKIQDKLEMRRLRKRIKFLERTVNELKFEELDLMLTAIDKFATVMSAQRETTVSTQTATAPPTPDETEEVNKPNIRLVEPAEQTAEMAPTSTIEHIIPTAPLVPPDTAEDVPDDFSDQLVEEVRTRMTDELKEKPVEDKPAEPKGPPPGAVFSHRGDM